MSLAVCIKKRLGDFELDADFVSQGGVTGLLGASGCGKSATLRCIAGILRPDEGKITLNGRVLFDSAARIDLPPQKRRVGYLFQNYALFPNMTVEKNIACGIKKGTDKSEARRRVSEVMERMDLAGLEKHRPHMLSGGQQQRAALARILVGEPEMLMLDEPFSALDSHLKERLMAGLKSTLEAFQRDTLLVTHDRDEAYQLCRHIAVVDQGRIDVFGSTQEIFSSPRTCAGAKVTGCKNITAAQKTGEYEVYAPEWGVRLKTAERIADGLAAVGVRAHFFGNRKENAFPIEVISSIAHPFEHTVIFRYCDQNAHSEPVLWKTKEMPAVLPSTLGVLPENVMPLYHNAK